MRVILRQCELIPSLLVCPPRRPFSRSSVLHKLSPAASATPRFARWLTTSRPLASSDDVMSSGFREPESTEIPDTLPLDQPGLRDLGTPDRKKEFETIMEGAQPDQIMAALLDPRFEDLVVSMPQSAFVEAFHLLSPAYFVEPYKEIYKLLHPRQVYFKSYRSIQSLFDEFAMNLSTIVRIRRSAGRVLGIAEYTHLLDCARSLGDAQVADLVWYSMKQDGVSPDLQCYNHYMEAKVWDCCYTGLERYRLRMTPYAYRKRRLGGDGWRGHGTGPRSVREEVRRLFNEMVDAGHSGDETSIVNLFLAASRTGHVKGMKALLKHVWNLDVDLLQKGVYEKAAPLDRSSPFYPTSRLLFALAHAFGNNNDIHAALRAIDFISNAYQLEVPEAVWLELFERTFVLSRPRFGEDAVRNARGQVSWAFLKSMFQTMTAEPFNVRPTVRVHHWLAKIAWDQGVLRDFKHHMRAAYEILSETRKKRKAARLMVESYLKAPRFGNQMQPKILSLRGFADAVHTYEILRLRVMQQTVMLEHLTRLLLMNHRWTGSTNPVWQWQYLPRAIEEWKDFLPETFEYSTWGGWVEFQGATRWREPRLPSHRMNQVRRPSLGDNFEPDPVSTELDDEFVLANYRDKIFYRDLESPLLKRLFEPVRLDLDPYGEAEDAPPQETEEPEYDRLRGLDLLANQTWSLQRWQRHDAESRRQKIEELVVTFGFPDEFTIA